jgi:uncharacterized protein (TIGR03083 family)
MSVEPAAGGMQWLQGYVRVTLGLAPDEVVAALARLWSRVARGATELREDDWERPTRCSEWRAVDIVNHLADLNTAMREVVAAAGRGDTTGLFEGFDPRTVPKLLTDAASRDPQAALDRLTTSVQAMLDELDRLDGRRGELSVETPVGRQPLAAALLHVLWDTWLHERDLFLPLGHSVPELEDELRLCLLYTLRMSGYIESLFGREAHVLLRVHGGLEATLLLDVQAGATRFEVVEDDPTQPQLHADAATAVDALCGRADLDAALHGPEEMRASLRSLRAVLGSA